MVNHIIEFTFGLYHISRVHTANDAVTRLRDRAMKARAKYTVAKK